MHLQAVPMQITATRYGVVCVVQLPPALPRLHLAKLVSPLRVSRCVPPCRTCHVQHRPRFSSAQRWWSYQMRWPALRLASRLWSRKSWWSTHRCGSRAARTTALTTLRQTKWGSLPRHKYYPRQGAQLMPPCFELSACEPGYRRALARGLLPVDKFGAPLAAPSGQPLMTRFEALPVRLLGASWSIDRIAVRVHQFR